MNSKVMCLKCGKQATTLMLDQITDGLTIRCQNCGEILVFAREGLFIEQNLLSPILMAA